MEFSLMEFVLGFIAILLGVIDYHGLKLKNINKHLWPKKWW